jgi:hypothetical protein
LLALTSSKILRYLWYSGGTMVFRSGLVSFGSARVVLISYSDKTNCSTLPYRLLVLLMMYQKEVAEIVQIVILFAIATRQGSSIHSCQ